MTGIELIEKERNEQIIEHKWSLDYDELYNSIGQLVQAANALIVDTVSDPRQRLLLMPSYWDSQACLKMCMKSRKERLIIAGALIAAELDRINK